MTCVAHANADTENAGGWRGKAAADGQVAEQGKQTQLPSAAEKGSHEASSSGLAMGPLSPAGAGDTTTLTLAVSVLFRQRFEVLGSSKRAVRPRPPEWLLATPFRAV